MFTNHVRKCIEQEFKWLAIIDCFVAIVVSMMEFVDHSLDIFDDSLRIYCIRKSKIFMFFLQMYMDITLSEESIKYTIGAYLDPMYRAIIYILDISGEIFPVDIDHSAISDNPYIVVPIEHHVDQCEVYTHKIELKICCRNNICNRESIL